MEHEKRNDSALQNEKGVKITEYKYALERKEPYIVKTELTKNRRHQSYKWKEIALGKTKEDLEVFMVGDNKDNLRIVER